MVGSCGFSLVPVHYQSIQNRPLPAHLVEHQPQVFLTHGTSSLPHPPLSKSSSSTQSFFHRPNCLSHSPRSRQLASLAGHVVYRMMRRGEGRKEKRVWREGMWTRVEGGSGRIRASFVFVLANLGPGATTVHTTIPSSSYALPPLLPSLPFLPTFVSYQ